MKPFAIMKKNQIRYTMLRTVTCVLTLTSTLALTSCASSSKATRTTASDNIPGLNVQDGCAVLSARPNWHGAFRKTYQHYGVPPHVVMAIILQESSFKANARSPSLTSSAFGYPQAKDKTWAWYQKSTGNRHAKRNRLPDAVDFIGWYIKANHTRSGVSKWETEQQYYAYHDGMGGYERGTHHGKPWLLLIGKKVDGYARRYRKQLSQCFDY